MIQWIQHNLVERRTPLMLHLRGSQISGQEFLTSYLSVSFSLAEIITIVSVVMILTGVWCGIAAYLVNRTFLAIRFRHISERILPFVLIGLGIYILVEGFIVPIFGERNGI